MEWLLIIVIALAVGMLVLGIVFHLIKLVLKFVVFVAIVLGLVALFFVFYSPSQSITSSDISLAVYDDLSISEIASGITRAGSLIINETEQINQSVSSFFMSVTSAKDDSNTAKAQTLLLVDRNALEGACNRENTPLGDCLQVMLSSDLYTKETVSSYEEFLKKNAPIIVVQKKEGAIFTIYSFVRSLFNGSSEESTE